MDGEDGRTAAARRDTRQRLFEAAVELIAEQGFSATTVEDIAARAGVAKGTVYYNFAVQERALRGAAAARRRAAHRRLPGRRRRRCRRARRSPRWSAPQLEYIRRYRAFAQLLLSEMWRTNREWQQTLRLLRGEAIDVIAETVAGRAWPAVTSPPAWTSGRPRSALFGVGLVVAVDWLVFQPDRSIADVQEALLGIVRRVAQT